MRLCAPHPCPVCGIHPRGYDASNLDGLKIGGVPLNKGQAILHDCEHIVSIAEVRAKGVSDTSPPATPADATTLEDVAETPAP